MFIIADSMMYQVKEEGKNSIKFQTKMDVSSILKQNKKNLHFIKKQLKMTK